MDINENLQQTNTFVGGMDTDTSDMLMTSEKYRFAKNLRLITDSNSNSGELHLIEGGDPSYRNQLKNPDGTDITDWNNITIVKSTQIRDYGIFIAQYSTEGWCIYTIHNNVRKLIFGPCTEALGDNISLVARYETDDVIKLYIADGVHSLMSINILEDLQQDATSDISTLTTIKQHSMVKPIVGSFGTSGTFKPGMAQYAYILYNKYGSHTNLSPLSNMVNVKSGNRGESAAKTVSFSATISVSETTSYLYKKIRLYRILYTQIGQDPTISLIADDDLTNESFSYLDNGTKIINLSVDEFLALDNYNVFPNEIESKNDYLFSGNVKDYLKTNQDIYTKLKQDIGDKKFQVNTENQLLNLSFNETYNPSYWDIYGNGQWSPSTTTGKYIQWRGVRSVFNNNTQFYMTDEIYRFGLVLYDKNGIQWPVIWVADVRTPDNIYISSIGGYLTCYGYEYGFRMSGNYTAFQNRYGDFFTHYEIVRCNRTWGDKHILSQGIAGRALQSYKYNIQDNDPKSEDGVGEEDITRPNNFLTSSGFMTFTDVVVYSKPSYLNDARRTEWGMGSGDNCREFSSASDKYLIFSSPEACYQQDDLINAMKQYRQSLKFKTRYYRSIPFNKDSYNLSCHFGDEGVGFYTLRMYCERLMLAGFKQNQFSLLSVDYSKCDNSASDGWNYGGPNFRSAMWFPIFEYKRSTPEYRDSSETRRNWRGLTKDTQRDWILPIKNVMTAEGIINPISGNDTPVGNYEGFIEEFQEITVPTFDQFMTGDNLAFRDNSTIINDRELLAWSVPGYAGAIEKGVDIKNTYKSEDLTNCVRDWYGAEDNDSFYKISTMSINFPVSAIGAGIVLQTDSQFEQQNITVPNTVNNTSPWGTYKDHITDGDFIRDYLWKDDTQQIDYPTQSNFRLNYYPGLPEGSSFPLPNGYASVPIVDIVNDAVIPYGGFTKYAREHSVYQSYGCYGSIGNESVYVPGDCFYNTFEYNSAKSWYNAAAKYAPHMTTVYEVPLLSSIHMNLDHGDKFSVVNEDYRIQDTPSEVRGYVQDKPAYAYNTAYSNQNSAKFYVGNAYEDDNINCDVRIFNSSKKTNGENTDKWLEYKSSGFIDVDSRYGQITNLKLFKDTLLFNQENATGVLSVNERTLIEDTNGENIILGNGSVLQRYDYVSTIYGMHKGDHACGNSDTTLYWWDRDNKEMLMYSRNGFAPMKAIKNVRKYVDTQDLTQSNPVVIYDNDHSEILFGLGNNKLLSYNEVTQRFVSEYDQVTDNVIYLPTQLILTNGSQLYEWNKRSQTPTLLPYIKYVVNKNATYNKVFDNIRFGGRFYGGDTEDLQVLTFTFNTPLKQYSTTTGADLTNYEYDFRMSVPRDNNADAGGRMRGKTMECIIESSDTSEDFSLQYITTKFRMSWT